MRLWSAEAPNLYTLWIRVFDSKGNETHALSQAVGFREATVKNGQFLVNGQPILFKGVNRHEHHESNGHVISKEDMLQLENLTRGTNIIVLSDEVYEHMIYDNEKINNNIYAVLEEDYNQEEADSDAKEAKWFDVEKLPHLIWDNESHIKKALNLLNKNL